MKLNVNIYVIRRVLLISHEFALVYVVDRTKCSLMTCLVLDARHAAMATQLNRCQPCMGAR